MKKEKPKATVMRERVTRGRVTVAIYDLAGRNDRWPTLPELADEVGAPVVFVHERLNDLVRARLFRSRRDNGRMVWLPWEQA